MSQDLKQNYKGVFDGRIGFGERPAVLVVDFINAYVTPGSPLYAEGVVAAVEETRELLDEARRRGVPVVYFLVRYQQGGIDGGIFVRKVPTLKIFAEPGPLGEISPRLPPGPKDIVIPKQYASAFFGTSLAALLAAEKRDTLIVTGCSTSGCVRATAVDGMQYGYRVIVPRECVGDRHAGPHEANLFDIDSKYGDVLPKAEVLDYLRGRNAA
ncbi:MAG: isochorismatase family protein [Alphaproteobacteria bacterium]|nr:isochorismatase family protein [Alphaproteobacteria bacterium]